MVLSYFVFQADADVDQFMQEEHTFDEYTKEVEKYHRLNEEIMFHTRKVSPN